MFEVELYGSSKFHFKHISIKMTKNQKIEELLSRGVEEIISRAHLERRIKLGEKLRVKFGIDPTSADLHLGHAIPLHKLRQFQELGHRVILLIGDFTAMIGDPSGRSTARRPLTAQEIKKNMADYVKQAGKIIDIKKAEVRHNSEWYSKKGAGFLMDLSSRFTYARLIERSEFKKRIAKDIDVTMLELLYPLLQGYDSVELKADLEIGGTDQKFNLLMGRKVQRKFCYPQQDIMTLPLLVGTDGIMKMSKSYGNYIRLTGSALEMYGKIMSIPDTIMWHYFKFLTDLSLEEIGSIKNGVYKLGVNPLEAKARLAYEIVRMYHNKEAAILAKKEFDKTVKEGGLPSEIPTIAIKSKVMGILDLLVAAKLAPSKAQAKRLVEQGGVKIDRIVKNDWRELIEIKRGQVIQAGKRKFAKLS